MGKGGTFEEIWVEIGYVLDQPGLAFLEIGSEFAVFCGETAYAAVENSNWLGFFSH